MMRHALLAGLSLSVLSSCGRGTEPAVPAPGLVVSDSLGTLVQGAVPSPDGTRLAFMRTVAGRSAIFAADADGSNPVRLTHGVWDFQPVWSPDGRWIAYHAESPDFDVFVVPAEGGEPRQLTSGPANDGPRGWLPDGSGVVFSRTGQGDDVTMVVPLDGGPPRRLGPPMEGNQHAALSPDGSRLAFDLHRGGSDATIWVQALPDGEPRQLTTENLENASVPYIWSPDGRYLAYTSRRTGTRDIWIVDVETGESRQLTTDVRDDHTARWSPDGRWVAFLSDRGGQHDIWVVPAAGGAAVRVTDDQAVETFPQWARDGSALYYTSTHYDVALQLQPIAGGAPRTLLSWSGYQIPHAALSPDGRTVLFTANRSGNFDLWSLPVDGGEPAVFAASPLNDGIAHFSPDGSQVLFNSDRAGGNSLWIVPAAGGEPRRLTDGQADESEPAWSPDGQWIAFASTRDVAGGDLWVVPAAGGEATRLTHGDMRPASLHWSPDGTHVYFIGARPGGGREQYRIAARGGRPQALGANRAIGTSVLSPDGSRIAYASFEGGWAFTDLMPAAGGPTRRLTDRTENVFQPSARWAPDGSLLVVHDLDFETNRDNFDLFAVRPSDGAARRVTATPMASEQAAAFTPDGREVLVIAFSTRNRVLRTPVAGLLAGRAPE